MNIISGSTLKSDISDVIDAIGEEVDVYDYDPTINDRGDATSSYSNSADRTPTAIVVAESDILSKEAYGEPMEGAPMFIFKGDATITEGDKIVWNSLDFKVLDADIVPLSGTAVVTHVQATLMTNT